VADPFGSRHGTGDDHGSTIRTGRRRGSTRSRAAVSPGDQEIVRARLLERGTRTTIGRSELVCTFVDAARSRVCRGTYILPKGKIVVGGSLLYRQFYDLAVLGGTGLYDNARGTVDRHADAPQAGA
jgi:hypothetical protein